jgi:hypothetical protein
VPELQSSDGLGLVPFLVLPHDDDPEVRTRNDAIVALHHDADFVRLTDDRAVLVRGDRVEVVDSPSLA